MEFGRCLRHLSPVNGGDTHFKTLRSVKISDCRRCDLLPLITPALSELYISNLHINKSDFGLLLGIVVSPVDGSIVKFYVPA